MRNNHPSAANRRREQALKSLEAHVKTQHEDKDGVTASQQIQKHNAEIKVLQSRVASKAKFRKYLKRVAKAPVIQHV